jgi:hypothetical protein
MLRIQTKVVVLSLLSAFLGSAAYSQGLVFLDAACVVSCLTGRVLVPSDDQGIDKYTDVKREIYYDLVGKTRKQIDVQVQKACEKISREAEYLSSNCVYVKH